MTRKPVKLPDVGVWVIEGLPGSGKSFYAVRSLLDWVLVERRPVFSNLPIKWRVLRKYLAVRGGPTYANLVYELTRDHFARFIDRSCRKQKLRQELQTTGRDGRPLSHQQLQDRYTAELGPDVYRGAGANHVPPGAVLIIDEAQLWYPMKDQAREDPNLLGYLSMIRHHVHLGVFITQEAGRISKSIRVMAQRFVRVRDKGDDKFAWNIRFRHVGIRGIGYAIYNGDALNDRALDSEPVANFALYPWLPSERVIFRLYSSFTHIGSLSRTIAALRQARAESGVTEEVEYMAVQADPWIMRVRRYAFVALLCSGAAVLGGAVASRTPAPVVVNRPAAAAAEVASSSLTGVGVGSVHVDGKRVSIGESSPLGFLRAVSVANRRAVFERDGVAVVCEVGGTPRELGRAGDVLAACVRLASKR
jgi:hypothetical protein